MKRNIGFITLLIALLFTLSLVAMAGEYGELTYEIENGEVTITGCDKEVTSVTVPAKIDGYPVTKIKNSVFMNCKNLKSVTLPDTVTEIGNNAFYDCILLEEINLPDSITRIGNYAFHRCEKLTAITLPKNLTKIENSLFCRCTSLTEITLPDSITYIGYSAFLYCHALEKITIPPSVTDISNDVFRGCTNLTIYGFVGSDAEKYAAKRHFGFSSLGTLWDRVPTYTYVIENSEVIITGRYEEVTEVVIPSRVEGYPVTTIADMAFLDCISLERVTLPEGLKTIGKYAFNYCINLEGLTIPESVTTIKDCAFTHCKKITSIRIPESVTDMGKRVFGNMDSLTEITVGKSNTAFTSVDGVLYSKDMSKIIAYPKGKKDKSFTIPEGIKVIEEGAFAGNRSLETVVIPDSIQTIWYNAFRECENLKNVTIPDGVTYIGDWAFSYCTSLESIVIPESVGIIATHTFNDSNNLKSITIPKNTTVYEDTFLNIPDLTIYGYKDSSAEKHAERYNFKFVALDGKEEPIPENPFTDVAKRDWFYGNVIAVYKNKLMMGNSLTTFNPSGTMSLAEAVTIASRMHYKESHTDELKVAKGSTWYVPYVDYALNNGIIIGGDFTDYTRPATRGEMAYIFSRAVTDLEVINKGAKAPDVEDSYKYVNSVNTLYKTGIVTGSDEKGNYYPDRNITRAEVATIVSRLTKLTERIK